MYKKIGVVAVAAFAALALVAGPASAKTLRGTVVHTNHSAHSFVVANARGVMTAVHSRRALKPGRIVRLSARQLRNGTFALSKVHVLGRTRHARLRGTVTFARRGSFVVSATGSSVLVQEPASSQPPAVGDEVQVDGTIDDQGDIQEQDVQQTGGSTGNLKLEGSLLGVDQTARTLSVSADDDNQSGAALTVDVPQSFDITLFQVGQEVELIVTPNGDGTYTLVSSSEDGNSQQANDQHGQQGDDQESDQTDQGDQHDQPGQQGDSGDSSQPQSGDSSSTSGGSGD